MSIEKKGQMHIEAAKKYAAQQDTSWWDEFFSDQQGIMDNCVSGDNWSLETQFTWLLQLDCVNNTPDQPNNAINDSLVHHNKETFMWDQG